ncbi:hypothetical protein PC9H_006698 [Pleurotus ostreatus]|uniref:Uncharacterized protein n=1 Tax=Pleurotus ostreatus TaxID=5322 RepID=A0A8H7DT93_PLEOS|nr:uncharacterized protein PC9H_006698 [Pleurotus ostreatus]KAF7430983.1 hypothetical protein PC9H_006698 [Pleurotus ostreatus]
MVYPCAIPSPLHSTAFAARKATIDTTSYGPSLHVFTPMQPSLTQSTLSPPSLSRPLVLQPSPLSTPRGLSSTHAYIPHELCKLHAPSSTVFPLSPLTQPITISDATSLTLAHSLTSAPPPAVHSARKAFHKALYSLRDHASDP